LSLAAAAVMASRTALPTAYSGGGAAEEGKGKAYGQLGPAASRVSY